MRFADFHCDLLSYVAAVPGRSALDAASRCGLRDLVGAGVRTQVLALYVPGQLGDLRWGLAQVDAFEALLRDFPQVVRPWTPVPTDTLGVMAAIENASVFAGEDEPLGKALERFDAVRARLGPLAYVSLTWAVENRFGGGNGTDVGLKPDGAALVRHLVAHGVPVDVSHASDRLCDDVLDLLAAHAPDGRVVASHANFRAVQRTGRNLRDETARAVARQGGVIGLTVIRGFVGGSIEALARHVEHGLSLGLSDHLALGADFFYEKDLPEPSDRDRAYFFDGYETAACYPRLGALLSGGQREAGVSDGLLHGNVERFLASVWATAAPGGGAG